MPDSRGMVWTDCDVDVLFQADHPVNKNITSKPRRHRMEVETCPESVVAWGSVGKPPLPNSDSETRR